MTAYEKNFIFGTKIAGILQIAVTIKKLNIAKPLVGDDFTGNSGRH
jgi:hypothetical protein